MKYIDVVNCGKFWRFDFDEKMEWTATERGGRKLILDGYIYVKKKNLADRWEIYECELRRNRHECKATIKVKASGDNKFKERTEHNHPADHGKANAYKVKAAMKRMAVETDESPHQILMATMYQATEEGLMAMPRLENIRRSIRRQRQDSQEALAMGRMVKDLGVLETQRTVASGLGLMAQPGLNNIDRCIQGQLQGYQGSLGIDRTVEDVEAAEGQRSVSAGQDIIAQPELNNIWSSIRRQQRDIHETFVERRNAEDQEILEGHRSSFPAVESHVTPQGSRSTQRHHQDIQEALAIHRNTEEQGNHECHTSFPAAEGHMALLGLRSTRMHNQDIKETLAVHSNSEDQGTPEDHRSSFPAAEDHITLPDLRSIRGQHQDIQKAFGIQWESEDLDIPGGQMLSLAREQLYGHHFSS